jgi:CheY-like chemotaxis protein/cell division protein FtsN
MRQRSVLVIENDQAAAETVSQTLEPHGFSVYVALTGESGLAMAEKILPVLVIVNLYTPGTGGLEICKKLKKLDVLKNTPIIVLTLRDGKFNPIYESLFGITDFLKKPLDPEALLSTTLSIFPDAAGGEAALHLEETAATEYEEPLVPEQLDLQEQTGIHEIPDEGGPEEPFSEEEIPLAGQESLSSEGMAPEQPDEEPEEPEVPVEASEAPEVDIESPPEEPQIDEPEPDQRAYAGEATAAGKHEPLATSGDRLQMSIEKALRPGEREAFEAAGEEQAGGEGFAGAPGERGYQEEFMTKSPWTIAAAIAVIIAGVIGFTVYKYIIKADDETAAVEMSKKISPALPKAGEPMVDVGPQEDPGDPFHGDVVPEDGMTASAPEPSPDSGARTAAKPAPAPAMAGSRHFVQFGAFSVHANAQRLARELSGRGFEVSITTSASRKGPLYRVLLKEGFGTYKQAQVKAREIRKATGLETSVFTGGRS